MRLPILLTHVIDSNSPLKNWLEEGGFDKDMHSEIVVVINAYKFTNGQNMLRQRTYNIRNHVKYGYRFMPIVKHPMMSPDRKPRVRWQHFHDIFKSDGMEQFPSPPLFSRDQKNRTVTSMRMQGFHSTDGQVKRLERYANELGKTVSINGENLQRFMQYFTEADADMGNSLPPPLALHPTLPGKDRFREVEDNVQNDLTVGASDLYRYSAAVGTDTLPGTSQLTFTPLPADFRELAAEAQLNALEEGKRQKNDTPPALTAPPRSVFQDEEDAGPIHLEYVSCYEEFCFAKYLLPHLLFYNGSMCRNRESQNRSLAAFASLLKEGQGEESNFSD